MNKQRFFRGGTIKKVSESWSRGDRDQVIYFESQDQHTYGLTGNFQEGRYSGQKIKRVYNWTKWKDKWINEQMTIL